MSKIKKKQLGKGIRALLSDMDEKDTGQQQEVIRELSHTVAMIPVGEIEVNPFQPRTLFDPETLDELASSIRVHGLIQPLTLRRLTNNQYQLISGERRLRASKMAGLSEVPAYIRLADDQEMLEMALVENIQRQDLNAMEVAITYQRLIDECQLTHEALSDRVGKKRSSVSNYLRLLKLPPEVQRAIKSGEISMGHARALAGVEDLPAQLVLFRKTLDNQLSVRALEKLVRDYQQPGKKPSGKDAASMPSAYRDVERQFREFFGSQKLQVRLRGKDKGQITIPFGSVEELNRLLDALDKE